MIGCLSGFQLSLRFWSKRQRRRPESAKFTPCWRLYWRFARSTNTSTKTSCSKWKRCQRCKTRTTCYWPLWKNWLGSLKNSRTSFWFELCNFYCMSQLRFCTTLTMIAVNRRQVLMKIYTSGKVSWSRHWSFHIRIIRWPWPVFQCSSSGLMHCRSRWRHSSTQMSCPCCQTFLPYRIETTVHLLTFSVRQQLQMMKSKKSIISSRI